LYVDDDDDDDDDDDEREKQKQSTRNQEVKKEGKRKGEKVTVDSFHSLESPPQLGGGRLYHEREGRKRGRVNRKER